MSTPFLSSLKAKLGDFDLPLLLAALILVGIGISTIESSILAGEGLSSDLSSRQILAVFFGLILFFLVAGIDYSYFNYLFLPFFLITVFLLVLLLVFGRELRGSTRWFIIGDYQLQVSEYAKILLIVSWASFLSRAGPKINQFRYLLFYFILLFLPAVLVYLQPDLGTTAVLVFIWIFMLYLSPIQAKILVFLSALLAVAVSFLWFFLKGYQKDRIFSFLSPMSDPLGSGYHILQSIIAVGSGGLTGRGWGRGTQSHLRFLPEQHTDFIFATFAEEAGFLGVMLAFFLFGIILWRAFKAIKACPTLFGRLLAGGIFTYFFIQVVVNIAMNVGLAPITGIPLPLISYGGSSILATFMGLGVLQSVAKVPKL